MSILPDPNGRTGFYAAGIVARGYSVIGKPYILGANGPDAFDCSGLVQWCCKQVSLPGATAGRWTTYTMINMGDEVRQDQLGIGDWVFPDAGHVGIYIGNGDILHAPEPGQNVKVSKMWKWWRARRLYVPMPGAGPADLGKLGNLPNATADLATGVAGEVGNATLAALGLEKAWAWMGDGQNWVRIGTGAIGAVALLLGVASVAKGGVIK